jgi:hypothetical protein
MDVLHGDVSVGLQQNKEGSGENVGHAAGLPIKMDALTLAKRKSSMASFRTDLATMTAMKPNRWCIYIDLLGFSALWEREHMKGLKALRELMRAIYRIGTCVYPTEGKRFSFITWGMDLLSSAISASRRSNDPLPSQSL